MESVSNKINCPIHNDELIRRVSLDIDAKKQLFCIECLLNLEPGLDKSKIKSLDDFLDIAGEYYSVNKITASSNESIPDEYQMILNKQNENLVKLTNHLEEEKKRINREFENILSSFIQTLTKKREELCSLLEQQLFTCQQNYSYFEKQLQKIYPNEKSQPLYLSREVLQEKLNRITSTDDLTKFVKGIQLDINEANLLPKENNEKDILKVRKNHVKTLSEQLQSTLAKLPKFSEDPTSEIESKILDQTVSILDSSYYLVNEVDDITKGVSAITLWPSFATDGSQSACYKYSNNNRTIRSLSMESYGICAAEQLPKGKISTFHIQLGSILTSTTIFGITTKSANAHGHPYHDHYTRGYSDNGSAYPGSRWNVGQGFKANDKLSVTVDLKKGKITYFINGKNAFEDVLPEGFSSVEYYPFVYTEDGSGTGPGMEFTFVPK